MSVEENKAVARRFIEEVWNQGNLALIDELMAPGLVHHEADPSRTIDREGFKGFVAALRAAVPDIRFSIEDMLGEGEKVATRVEARGTSGGRPVAWSGIGIVRVVDGRIAEQWADTDVLDLAPGSAPSLQPA